MSRDLVERLNREIVRALANPEAISALQKTGVEPQSSSPEEFARYIEREYQVWGKVVKEAGIKAQ
jgi:tripartite-type tricarboxylate transporter receptor subunit TctC